MRVSGITTASYNRNLSKRNVGVKKINPEQRQNVSNVSFNGKTGAIAGALTVAALGIMTGGFGFGLMAAYGVTAGGGLAAATAAGAMGTGAYMGHKAEEAANQPPDD